MLSYPSQLVPCIHHLQHADHFSPPFLVSSSLLSFFLSPNLSTPSLSSDAWLSSNDSSLLSHSGSRSHGRVGGRGRGGSGLRSGAVGGAGSLAAALSAAIEGWAGNGVVGHGLVDADEDAGVGSSVERGSDSAVRTASARISGA